MDFAEALAHLDAHINLEATAGWVHGLSLDRMRGVTSVLGDPQLAAPVIHVTGTNGKGSTVRMISAILAAHGLSVGTYTSPHLESITERIARNGEPISERDLGEVVGELAACEELFPERPSYFELLTAAAFSWFAREAVDVAVVEVGLLGRFDATNVAHADVAVITNIGKDHTDGVGDWRRAVAEEKAGIIEPDSAVVLGEADPALVEVFRAEGGSLHWIRGTDFGVRAATPALGGRMVDLYTPGGRLDEVYLPVHGAHQVENAAVAVAAVEAFFGRPAPLDVVSEAFGGLRLPGRFEVVQRGPLVVLDGAHNPEGAAVAAATLRDEFTVAGRLTLVTGLLTGRDPGEVLAPLLELEPAVVLCVRPDSPRAVDPAEVAAVVRRLAPSTEVRVIEDVGAALGAAVDGSRDVDAVLVTGSLYVVGAARAACRRMGVL